MNVPLWSNDIAILFNNNYIKEVYPLETMSYEQKINSIVRLVAIVSVLGYIITKSLRMIGIGFITIIIIHCYVEMNLKNKSDLTLNIEGFSENNLDYSNPKNTTTLKSILKKDFQEGTKKNPFSNVLLTDISDNPDKKPAPPSFNTEIDSDIIKNIKKTVQTLNPDIKDTNKQLYGDTWENFNLDQSSRNFYSTPNTKVVNDQDAFAKFLYGDMPSAKESSIEGNLQREKNNYRYTMY